jgi:hypothetical protein
MERRSSKSPDSQGKGQSEEREGKELFDPKEKKPRRREKDATGANGDWEG